MNTKELIERLAALTVRCLEMETVTSVKTAGDTLRSAVAVLDATVGVMECAGRLSDLRALTERADALRDALDDAETALSSTELYIEQLQSDAGS